MDIFSVLGIDLASARWQDNGVATLRFRVNGAEPVWVGARLGASRPASALTAATAAQWIDTLARDHGCSAVSLDGPQGWRSPMTPTSARGVGRRSDLEARTQGKCGLRGTCFPGTQLAWFRFCIAVFENLLQKPDVRLANSVTSTTLAPPTRGYWLMESYPTSVWRTSGLAPLPGKSRATLPETRAALGALASTYGFAVETPTSPLSHDDVQALVAALPAAALVGGPAVAIPRGVPAVIEVDGSRSEGIIWDARPRAGSAPAAAVATAAPADDRREQEDSAAAGDHENRFLPDERDDAGFTAIVERGRRLLYGLAVRANRGEVVGLGYQQLLLALHDASTLGELLGRPQAQAKWSQAYGMWAMRLAVRINR